MSGLLRRIKRSRPVDAGQPEGEATAPEGAAPATDGPAGPSTDATAELPLGATPDAVGAEASDGAPESTGGATAELPPQEPEAGSAVATPEPPAAPLAEKPVLLADPGTPAGIDPTEASLRVPAGRRGRLRRRLRYLRRARELMLRDLGGLLYEVHRTAGGQIEPHATVIDAKVQRIVAVDAEAHALEAALSAPRAEAILFQPGVGGSCRVCGELHSSTARFCSSCGTPIGAETRPAPVQPGATREEVFARPAGERPAALSPGDPLRLVPAPQPGEDPALAPQPPTDPTPATEALAVSPSQEREAAADDPAAIEPPAAGAEAGDLTVPPDDARPAAAAPDEEPPTPAEDERAGALAAEEHPAGAARGAGDNPGDAPPAPAAEPDPAGAEPTGPGPGTPTDPGVEDRAPDPEPPRGLANGRAGDPERPAPSEADPLATWESRP